MSYAKSSSKPSLTQFNSPGTVIGRFVARRTLRSAAIWGLVFGLYVASKGIGFVDAYPNAVARQKAVALLSNNLGIEIILGRAPAHGSTGAYIAWNLLGVMVIIGGIWAMLLATKYFRGEEDNGRWEIMLAGQTTARKASANVLAGLFASLTVFYLILAAILVAIGRVHGIDYTTTAGLYFALATTLGVIVFMALGTFASQLMPTRSRANGVLATLFGVFYLLRAAGDISSAHWLLDLTPLGWVEKLQPLNGSHYLWFLPLITSILVLCLASIILAGKRDLGEGIIADNDSAKPRTGLLNTPLEAALRFTRFTNAGWLFGLSVGALLFGLLTKSVTQVFAQSTGAHHVFSRLSAQIQTINATAYLGIVFFMLMLVMMGFAASSLAAMRRDEAGGYIDNFLVRPVSRSNWLGGRLLIVLGCLLLAGLLIGAGVWLGIVSQHVGLALQSLASASANSIVPAIVTVGVGLCVFGLRPRLTAVAAYSVLAWSFLIEIVSSGLKLNHWLLDTSVLHHVVLAPAVDPNWTANLVLLVIAFGLGAIGFLAFHRRDLATE